jgi:hypothetical protein
MTELQGPHTVADMYLAGDADQLGLIRRRDVEMERLKCLLFFNYVVGQSSAIAEGR